MNSMIKLAFVVVLIISLHGCVQPQQSDEWRDSYNNGLALSASGNYPAAIEQFSYSIDKSPNSTDPYVSRAEAYLMLNQYDKALSDYSTVIEKTGATSTTYYLTHSLRGDVLVKKGLYQRAVDDYGVAISGMPYLPQVYESRGDAYKTIGNVDKALDDYRASLSLYGKTTPDGRFFALTPEIKQRIKQKIKSLSG